MRISNIIFKSLCKNSGISFPLLNHLKLRESKWMEKKVISYETGKEGDKDSPIIPPTLPLSPTITLPYTSVRLCTLSVLLCHWTQKTFKQTLQLAFFTKPYQNCPTPSDRWSRWTPGSSITACIASHVCSHKTPLNNPRVNVSSFLLLCFSTFNFLE